jgi:hypothetical protein
MAWYKTGTVSLNIAGASETFPPSTGTTYIGRRIVNGTGTGWTAGLVSVGEGIVLADGNAYEITAINETSQKIYLATDYLGSNMTGASYQIMPLQGYLKDLANRAASLIDTYSDMKNGPGVGKFPSGTAGIPGIRFSSDEDTGLHLSAGNTLELVSNGVSRATVSINGLTLSNSDINNSRKSTFVVPDTQTINTNRSITLPTVDGILVTRDATETLTNKTLTAPVINGTVTTTGLTLPAYAMGGAISNPSNYAANIGTGALTAGAGTFSGDIRFTTSGIGIYNNTVTNGFNYFVADGASYAGMYVYGTTHATKANNVEIKAGDAIIGTFSSTGLAVTGALTAGTGTFSGAVNGERSVIINNADTGTAAYSLANITNGTSGVQIFHLGTGFTSSGLYLQNGTLINANGAGGLNINANYSGQSVRVYTQSGLRGEFSSTGLAVTGALSCTGNTTLGDAAGDTLNVANGALQLDASGNLLLGKATATANGGDLQVSKGITFPATQVACSDANTLDDYEEGTWPPVLTCGTPGDLAVGTGGSRVGHYTKIGRQVIVSFIFGCDTFTRSTASGAMVISGLPFPVGATQDGVLSTMQGVTKAGYTFFSLYAQSGSIEIRLNANGSGLTPSNVEITDLPSGTAKYFYGTCSYLVS